MSAQEILRFINESGGEAVEVYQAEASGALPANRTLTVDDGKGPKLVLVLSDLDGARLCGALLPSAWWEQNLREAYRAGWALGAEEAGGVDRHARDNVHPGEDPLVQRLLAVANDSVLKARQVSPS
jgi:hypothetical protein